MADGNGGKIIIDGIRSGFPVVIAIRWFRPTVHFFYLLADIFTIGTGPIHKALILFGDILRAAFHDHFTTIEQNGAAAKLHHALHGVGDEQEGAATVLNLLNACETFTLEGFVANSQRFINHQYVGLHID